MAATAAAAAESLLLLVDVCVAFTNSAPVVALFCWNGVILMYVAAAVVGVTGELVAFVGSALLSLALTSSGLFVAELSNCCCCELDGGC